MKSMAMKTTFCVEPSVRYIALGFLLLGGNTSDPRTKKASDLLQKVTSCTTLEASFIYTKRCGKETEQHTGQLLRKGKKYRCTMDHLEQISDGQITWTYLKEVEEIQITDSQGTEVWMPWHILHDWSKDYTPISVRRLQVNGKICDAITLLSKDTEHVIPKIDVVVSRSTGHLCSLHITDTVQEQHDLFITQVRTDVKPSEGVFYLDPAMYKDAEVVDLR